MNQQPHTEQEDEAALLDARDVATRFKWFVVVGRSGALTARGKCCFKESVAAQHAMMAWEEAIGCFAPDGKFYRIQR
jgi:hypothetical protein